VPLSQAQKTEQWQEVEQAASLLATRGEPSSPAQQLLCSARIEEKNEYTMSSLSYVHFTFCDRNRRARRHFFPDFSPSFSASGFPD
jgi:hypothetical protein